MLSLDLDLLRRGLTTPALAPNGGSRDELRRRLRLAYVEGAETWQWTNVGRGLTRDEFAQVVGRFERRP